MRKPTMLLLLMAAPAAASSAANRLCGTACASADTDP
jgi:hypothetical protein